MKKHLIILFVLTMIFVVTSCNVDIPIETTKSTMPSSTTTTSNETDNLYENLKFKINSDFSSYSVAAKEGHSYTEIVIPSEYNGKPVTKIADNAFNGQSLLTHIEIPDSITEIGSHAFEFCSSLTFINIPSSISFFDGGAFANCDSLKNVYYSGTLSDWLEIYFGTYNSTPLNAGANLYFNGELVTNIIIPEDVTCFANYYKFYNCKSIESIEIHKNFTDIGWSNFDGCSSLVSITVHEDNPYYKSIDGNLYSKDGTKLIYYAIGKKDDTFTIPESVTYIGGSAFGGCDSIETVIMGDAVVEIDDGAFENCTSLKYVDFSESLQRIGNNAFSNCISLKSISLPDSLLTIGGNAFGNCSTIENVIIPDSTTVLEHSAFSGCSSLTFVEIGSGVSVIEDFVFNDCENLESVTMTNSVKRIKGCAFQSCESLSSILFKGTVEEWKAIEKYSDFDNFSGDYIVYCSNGEVAKDGTVSHYH